MGIKTHPINYKEVKMSYVVKHEKEYLTFDRHVGYNNGIPVIINTVEPVGNFRSATEFSNIEQAEKLIKEVTDAAAYNITGATVHDIETLMAEEKAEKEAKDREMVKVAWENTSEERKGEILKGILEKEGPAGVTKWLADVGDVTSTVPTSSTPATVSSPKFCSECGNVYGMCEHSTITSSVQPAGLSLGDIEDRADTDVVFVINHCKTGTFIMFNTEGERDDYFDKMVDTSEYEKDDVWVETIKSISKFIKPSTNL